MEQVQAPLPDGMKQDLSGLGHDAASLVTQEPHGPDWIVGHVDIGSWTNRVDLDCEMAVRMLASWVGFLT
jgi:hypothetical protein